MPESCVDRNMCGTYYPLWLDGPHPQLEDGVVTRQVCVSSRGGCCTYKSLPIRVKACPGNYYVYEFVKPIFCGAYCVDASSQSIAPPIEESTVESITSPIEESTVESITSPITTAAPEIFYPFGSSGDTRNAAADDGSSSKIKLLSPFLFFGHTYQQIYVNNNGHLTFNQSSSQFVPYSFPANGSQDIIAGLWTDLDNHARGVVSYHQYTNGSVLARATQDINNHFPNLTFNASWVFVATWDEVPYFSMYRAETSFQVVLISGSNFSFILMNYGDIDVTGLKVEAGYDTVNSTHYFVIPGSVNGSSIPNLKNSSNVNVAGRWAFRVDGGHNISKVDENPCSELSCSENERCGMKNGVYGCLCKKDHHTPQPHSDSFDFSETCESSSGSMSVSRCQLFEAGFPADVLHLNDPNCKGTVRNGRVEFHFDNDEHICGTNLVANSTHFIYDNFILGTLRSEGPIISREKILKLPFSCVYPQTQTLSMNVEINPLESIVHKTLPIGEGRYRVRMIPYQDYEFTRPFTGAVDAELNQEMHVEVRVEGVDSHQFALVLDTCWATPVNDPDYSLRWDLIVNECPNPNDGTVELLQNGVSTSSHFSFGMFIFAANSTKLYLHCAVHLCLLSSNRCSLDCDSGHQRREGRSLDFHDSASISMGPLMLSEGDTE
ncbi:pancreatic secretory granule membrane major glycoprotein GP2-like isoform X1 [Ctenopharyngodon idella]|uniref:pancreatic secretory granule membrane major glycoprotein GP2-like isoform X1 n=1 Tax=Ctenopharyngodon idella TaxID=7959 RepID=UPI0022321677|nr:pancreatic secretory granule membrane major glycoprotein GP2-like isoform X1 [Ctenopharyngodon idella]